MTTPPTPHGLIDPNVLVDATRGRRAAVNFMTAVSTAGRPPVSVVAVIELFAGAKNARDLANLKLFAQACDVLPVTPAVSQTALGLVERFTLSHGLKLADALIAATTLELGLPLYTLNVKHFQMIPGLTPVRPY